MYVPLLMPTSDMSSRLYQNIYLGRRIFMETESLSTSRRGFLKGLAVGAGACALGSLLIHPDEAMAQSIEDNMVKVPMEVRWGLVASGFVYWCAVHFKSIYDQGGKEKLVEFMKEEGRRYGAGYKGFADRFGFTGDDAKSAAAIISAMVGLYFGPQQKFEIEDATAQKARVKCANCAFWNMAKAMKINEDLCSGWSRYSWEERAKAINPRLISTLVKARPLGDPVCEWVIELKA